MDIHPYRENAEPCDQPRSIAATVVLEKPEAARGEKKRIDLRSNHRQKTKSAQIDCDRAEGSPHLHICPKRRSTPQRQNPDHDSNQILNNQDRIAPKPMSKAIGDHTSAPLMMDGRIHGRHISENVARKEVACTKTFADKCHLVPDVHINEVVGSQRQEERYQRCVSCEPQPTLAWGLYCITGHTRRDVFRIYRASSADILYHRHLVLCLSTLMHPMRDIFSI